MEVREKLSSTPDGLKILQDICAGHVPHVKKLTCILDFANFYFTIQPQPRKHCESLSTVKISLPTVHTYMYIYIHVHKWRVWS